MDRRIAPPTRNLFFSPTNLELTLHNNPTIKPQVNSQYLGIPYQ